MFYRFRGFFLRLLCCSKKENLSSPWGKEKQRKKNNGQATGFFKNQEWLDFAFAHKLPQASAPLRPGGPEHLGTAKPPPAPGLGIPPLCCDLTSD